MKFFYSFFFFSKALDMRWKDLDLVFDENTSISFYGPSKFFRFGDFKQFFEFFYTFSLGIVLGIVSTCSLLHLSFLLISFISHNNFIIKKGISASGRSRGPPA